MAASRSPSAPSIRRCTSSCRTSAEKLARLATTSASASTSWKSAPTACASPIPMMGHRGVRLGITYPEVTEMQIRAILEAAVELIRRASRTPARDHDPGHLRGDRAREPEEAHRAGLRGGDRQVQAVKSKLALIVGTMIEIPRACVMADKLAEVREFFSFGTNDLTQMGFGFSRDDIGSFLPRLPREEDPARRPVPDHRPGRRGRAHADGHRRAGRVKPESQDRHLRRARRRSRIGGVLPQRRHELRLLLALPRARSRGSPRRRQPSRALQTPRRPRLHEEGWRFRA